MEELRSYRESYEQLAATHPELAELSNEQLMLELSQHFKDKTQYRSVVFSYLMLRYWNVLRQYTNKSATVAEWQDVHDWLVDSITYVAEQRAWEKPGSTLQDRKRWADSAVNMRMKCTRINAYQASNRDKRYLDYTSASLESLEEEYGDAFQQNFAEDPLFLSDDEAYSLVKGYINHQEYFTALVVDAVVNHNVLEYNEPEGSQLSVKRLRKHLSTLPDSFTKYLQEEYSVSEKQAASAVGAVRSLDGARLETNVRKTLQQLYYQLWVTLKKGKNSR